MVPVVWTNPGFCAEMPRGFITVQDENSDGHIHHEGGMVARGVSGDVSVIPRYFEASEAMARVTRDEKLLGELYRFADLARRLGKTAAAARHRQQFADLKPAINRTLWNETHGAYLNFNLKTGQHEILLASHLFDPLRLGIAPPERAERLLQRLLDPAEFGWGGLGLTTLARQNPKFVVIKTPGFSFPAWDGGIWTMCNVTPGRPANPARQA
jgi:hypothetical protein